MPWWNYNGVLLPPATADYPHFKNNYVFLKITVDVFNRSEYLLFINNALLLSGAHDGDEDMLKTAEHVIYGATSVYALRGDEGVVKWETNSTVFVPRTDPCSRCDHQSKCLTLGNGKIDVVGCPTAEGWHEAKAAYEAAIKAR